MPRVYPPRLSTKQREALQAVAEGRVTYGDPYPRSLAKRVARAQSRVDAGEVNRDIIGLPQRIVTSPAALADKRILLDGVEIYGAQHATFASLGERDLIVLAANDDGSLRPGILTEAGQASLERNR